MLEDAARVGHAKLRRGLVLSRDSFQCNEPHPSEPGADIRVMPILGRELGAVHLAAAIVELAPAARGRGHMHPFEESFYILDGEPCLALGGHAFQLVPGDFGLAPVATGHAWSNPGLRSARLLRIYAPQPPRLAGRAPHGVYVAELEAANGGQPVDERDPRQRRVGHFSEDDVPPPGPLLMPGYHGPNIRNVSIRMMVDELLGARHHTLFVVQFAAAPAGALSAKEHYHPFEEAFFFLSGEATVSFDGVTTTARAGDLVFAGVGVSHGFSARGEQPVRWIEAQSPLPPASDGFCFGADWAELEALG